MRADVFGCGFRGYFATIDSVGGPKRTPIELRRFRSQVCELLLHGCDDVLLIGAGETVKRNALDMETDICGAL